MYKFDGSPVGWYARNLKNGDEIYLGAGASPTVDLENLEVKSVLRWDSINQPPAPPTDDANGDEVK